MRVTATRSGDWWALEAEHEGQTVFSQARRLEQIDDTIRDAFATLDLDVSAEDIDVVVNLEGGLDEEVAAATSASLRAAEVTRTASEAMRSAVTRLRRSGLTVRDTAVVLKVSPQRISQLDSSAAPVMKTTTGTNGRVISRSAVTGRNNSRVTADGRSVSKPAAARKASPGAVSRKTK